MLSGNSRWLHDNSYRIKLLEAVALDDNCLALIIELSALIRY